MSQVSHIIPRSSSSQVTGRLHAPHRYKVESSEERLVSCADEGPGFSSISDELMRRTSDM